MRRYLTSRLAKAEELQPPISWVDRQAARHRQSLRTCAHWHELIRQRLEIMGIDSGLAVALRRGEEAAAELAAIPNTPELKAADEVIISTESSDWDDRACKFEAKIARTAEQYRTSQHQPDLANASPVELLAFCVAVEIEAWAD